MDKDSELFKGISFSDVMHKVYDNSKKKDRQIKLLIGQLEPLIKDLNDATIVVPLIKEYMDVAVKNDEQIVKLAAIIQRMLKESNSEGGSGGTSLGISEEELKQLRENADEIDEKIDALKNNDEDDD